MLRLRIVPPQGEPYDQACQGPSVVMGRSAEADIVLADRYLSRKHARLREDGDTWYVEDLGSRNTTLLNGQPVLTPRPIKPGDVIKMSGSVVLVQPAGPIGGLADGGGTAVYRPASELIDNAEGVDTGEMEGEAALKDYAARLQLLNEIHRALARPISLTEVFELILDRAFEQLQPEEGVIFLKRADGEFTPAAARRLPELEAEFPYSRHLIGEVAEKGMAALVFDARTDERFANAASIVSAGVRSLVAAPLLDAEGSLGMIALSSHVHARQFSEEDLELLVSLASMAALRIRNVGLMQEAARHRQLEKELALAREIQLALLPDRLPHLPGYSFYASTEPSWTVSGDLHELVTRGRGRECVLLVADVAGKGISASLLTASLEALATGPIEVGYPPEEICDRLSRRLYRRTPPERFATAFVGALEANTGVVRYANAGHNPALILRRHGEVERLTATGIPLGVLEAAPYSGEEVILAPGDTLLIYTDGITEATNPEGEEYGLERLEELSRSHRHEPLEQLAAAIERHLEEFVSGGAFADDRTLVMVRCLG